MSSPPRRGVGASALVHGLPGHPLHPPLTDATIGMFGLAAGLGVIGKAGAITDQAGPAMWLALIGGLIVAGATPPTRVAGLVPLPPGRGGRGPGARGLAPPGRAPALFSPGGGGPDPRPLGGG